MERYGPRIAALARRAERDRHRVAKRESSTLDDEDAVEFLRVGAGQAIWIYVEGRTGGRLVHFSPAELAALEDAMNDWFECYAHCHGVEIDADVSIREAAELLLKTENVRDVAQLVTGVPERSTERT